MWEPLIVTSLLAFISTLIGIALYKRSEGQVKNRWARFSGAAAIAFAAYIGMTKFYLELSDRIDLRNDYVIENFRNARNDYNICLEHEGAFACREPATKLRDVCSELIEPKGSNK